MKVYVQLGGREKIDFDLSPSDDIWVVKNKIAEDRAIPVTTQRIFGSYQSEEDLDLHKELRNGAKLSKVKNDIDTSEYLISPKRPKNDYIRLYVYVSFELDVRFFGENEFPISFNFIDANLKIDSVKDDILKFKGYPCSLQKLYLGDSSMAELSDYESIMSPQIFTKICNFGVILRLTGKIPVRHITKGTICYPEIDAMVTIARLKKQICEIFCEEKPIHLYLNDEDIKKLDDSKRLCEYNIKELLSLGLLIKPKPMCVYIKDLNGKNLQITCDVEEPVDGFKDRVSQMTGYPIRLLRLKSCGNQLGDGILRDYNVTDHSTIHMIIRKLGD